MNSTSTNIDSLEIRRSKALYIFIALLFVLVFVREIADKKERVWLRDILYNNFSWTSVFFILMILSVVSYLILVLTDNKIKVIINNDGIWSKKYNTTAWKYIWYLYRTEHSERGLTSGSLIIKLRGSIENPEGKELKISLSDLNVNTDELMKILQIYSDKYGIQNLGQESN